MKNINNSFNCRKTTDNNPNRLSDIMKISILFLLILIGSKCKSRSENERKEVSQNKEDVLKLLPGTIKIQDKKGNLVLNINYRNKCVVDYVETLGHAVITNNKGVFSAIKSNGNWFNTCSGIPEPKVLIEGDRISIEDILFGAKNSQVSEKWIFQCYSDYIDWTVERTYPGEITLEDTGFP